MTPGTSMTITPFEARAHQPLAGESQAMKAIARGTRIIEGDEADVRRDIIDTLIGVARDADFDEVVLPTIEPSEVYADRAGPEVLGQMYVFPDKGGRSLCLRPEATATIQALARDEWKMRRDVKVWYCQQCFRYERPQAGRYREFTQFGVEWVNPRDPKVAARECRFLAMKCAQRTLCGASWNMNESVKRGLAYYTGAGFEISVPSLGAQKQVCGGGPYDEGYGFAFGVDRLMIVA